MSGLQNPSWLMIIGGCTAQYIRDDQIYSMMGNPIIQYKGVIFPGWWFGTWI